MEDVKTIDLRLPIDTNLNSLDYEEIRDILFRNNRRQRNAIYESDKKTGEKPPKNIVYVLDRRINWATNEDLLEEALDQLNTKKFVRRNQTSSQWVLYSLDYEHVLQPTFQNEKEVGEDYIASLLLSIKKMELERILMEKAVFFSHSGHALFRLPNGELSDYFFRLGNVQRSVDIVEILAFWCLPFLKRTDHIICDTWSISTSAALFSIFLDNYKDSLATRVSWSFLSSYLPDEVQDVRHVKALAHSAKNDDKIVTFLVSASASGRLHSAFNQIISGVGAQDHFEIVTLFSLGKSCPEGFVVHSLDSLLHEKGLYGINIPNYNPVPYIIDIDGGTYIPKYKRVRTSSFSVVKQTSDARSFFEKYSGNKIFSIARRGKSSHRAAGRHYTYHIDANELFQHPLFRKELEAKIRDIGKIDCLIYPDIELNQEFIKLISDVHVAIHGCSILEVHSYDRFEQIEKDDSWIQHLLNEQKQITFADGLVVTGSNIRDLTQAIRRLNDQGASSKSNITYLVGLYRPYSYKKDGRIRKFEQASKHDGFKGKATFLPVERIVLPLYSEQECPWKRELNAHLKAIEKTTSSEEGTRYIQRRIEILENSGVSGLRGDDIFFKRYPHDNFPFWSGSYFLDTNEVIRNNAAVGIHLNVQDLDIADLVCAVACAVHKWRCDNDSGGVFSEDLDLGELIRNTNSDKQVDLMPDDVTSENVGFNEPMLRAAIWRALLPMELNTERSNTDNQTMLMEIFFDQSVHNSHSVLGGEAALIFGHRLVNILGAEDIERIDWEYLKILSKTIQI